MRWLEALLCYLALAGSVLGCAAHPVNNEHETRWYVVSSLAMPVPLDGTAYGFDLDARASIGGGTACLDRAADFASATEPGETGVDNAFSMLVPTISAQLAGDCDETTPREECLDELLQDQIASGAFLLLVEVAGIHSYANDAEVEVRLHRGTVPGCEPEIDPCPPLLADGAIAEEQVFDTTPMGDVVRGEIVSGRLRVSMPVIGIAFGGPMLLLRDAHMSGTISRRALTAGAIGGALRIADICEEVMRISPTPEGCRTSLLEPLADLEPEEDPTMCAALSAGLSFSATDAAGEGEPVAD